MCGMTLKAICLVNLPRLVGIADEDVAALLEQLVHARLAGAGDRLVGRDDHALDRRRVVQRLQRHHHLRGRAIGVGDDVLASIAVDRVGIHLGHDQRHVRVHPVERAVVDHRAAGRGGAWAHGPCDTSEPAANSAMSQPAKSKCSMFWTLSSLPLSPKSMMSPVERGEATAATSSQREFALGEDVQHLAPDIAGRADDHYPITHDIDQFLR